MSIKVCPECDSANLSVKTESYGRPRTGDGDYYCHDCQQHIEYPDERERRTDNGGENSDTRRLLLQADPDDLPI